MPKVAIRRYHLPIDDEAAGIIRAQQARVRGRFPETPISQLALFPALPPGDSMVPSRSAAQSLTDSRRSARAQLDTSVPVRFLGAVGQSSPNLFPSVQRHHEADDDD